MKFFRIFYTQLGGFKDPDPLPLKNFFFYVEQICIINVDIADIVDPRTQNIGPFLSLSKLFSFKALHSLYNAKLNHILTITKPIVHYSFTTHYMAKKLSLK